jgi:hypothetical protein
MVGNGMKIKKTYRIGDKAWVYGITTGPGYNRLTEGTVVHVMDIEGYSDTQYVIAISNGIEDLLEVRSWQSMSQDNKGPIGSFRELLMNRHAEQKVLMRTGMRLPVVELNPEFVDDQEPDQNQD